LHFIQDLPFEPARRITSQSNRRHVTWFRTIIISSMVVSSARSRWPVQKELVQLFNSAIKKVAKGMAFCDQIPRLSSCEPSYASYASVRVVRVSEPLYLRMIAYTPSTRRPLRYTRCFGIVEIWFFATWIVLHFRGVHLVGERALQSFEIRMLMELIWGLQSFDDHTFEKICHCTDLALFHRVSPESYKDDP
jgi:hypothetical protein